MNKAPIFQIGDEVAPNGFPTLRAMVTGVTDEGDGYYTYQTVWLVTERGSGSLHARKGYSRSFMQDEYGNADYQAA